MNFNFTIEGNLVDVFEEKIYPAAVTVAGGKIQRITPLTETDLSNPLRPAPGLPYILPGFVDAHVHIESSMLIPSEFARLAVVHGTVATVSDPHEIANVCGMEGVEFMIENGKSVPFKFYFGAPSCVPATVFETAGATLNARDVEALMSRDDIYYLSEMMNFPGVINGDEEVMQKIAAAGKFNKPVDGHAPGLGGLTLKQYIEAGSSGQVVISTDHECFTKEEALEKLQGGMKIIIREGSAAKNFEALIDLLHHYPDRMMFCSDDKHPDSLVEGHINQLCARAVAKGIDVFKVLKAASVNPGLHYKLKVGLLKPGHAADFILVNNLSEFKVLQTFVNGMLVAEKGKSNINRVEPVANPVNRFCCDEKKPEDFRVRVEDFNFEYGKMPVIEALDGQLITNKIFVQPRIEGNVILSDVENDILKIVVVNRYNDAPVAKAFIKNFGLKTGAIASSVAHDSHNIVAVGVDDDSICRAVNAVIKAKGGIAAHPGLLKRKETHAQPLQPLPSELQRSEAPPSKEFGDAMLPLPVGGLMSAEDGYAVAEKYAAIDKAAKELGSTLSAPFMTLSFMALLVIPHLKLSDLGLFDGDRFAFVNDLQSTQ